MRNVIREEGGIPGFDELAFLTMTFPDKDSCARCSALNVSFTEVVACRVHRVRHQIDQILSFIASWNDGKGSPET